MPKNIQRAGGEQFQSQGDFLRLFLRLLQQHLAQGGECGNSAGLLRLLIHRRRASVDDGLLLRPDTVGVDALHQGHDKLRLDYDGIVLTVTVHHIHGVEPVFAPCGNADDGGKVAHGLGQRRIFALGITD